MKLYSVRFIRDISIQGFVGDNAYSLQSIRGWELEAGALGVVARHPAQSRAILVPWSIIEQCDLAEEAPVKLKAAK